MTETGASEAAAMAPSGRFDGDHHRFPVRVYWEDTDGSGIVYHASYLRFAERARTEMLRLAGTHQGVLLGREGIAFPVRHCEIDFLSPAVIDDYLEVLTRVGRVGGASIHLLQTIMRGPATLVRMAVRVACIDRARRPARLPAPIKAALERLHDYRE